MIPSRHTETLCVYLLNRKVGRIDYCSHRNEMHFVYDKDYLAEKDAVPLSYAMPLGGEPFDSSRTTVFFENLLPPDSVRRKLGPVLHISRHNIFGFLKALGGDCAGAIAMFEPGIDPGDGSGSLMPLDEIQADEVLKSLKNRPLYVNGVDGYRISGAGAQNKLIARIDGGKIVLPLFGAPSTHIIKPGVSDYPDTIYNEMFAMRLAARIGLPAAECGILRIRDDLYYWTKRFDREIADGRIARLHQEDFCQITGTPAEMKYESEGGPSFARCMAAIRGMRLGLAHQLSFIDRMVFSFLIGNADAHAKNSSVLYRGNKASLAPIYDVMTTAVYPELSRVNAMSIGGSRDFDGVSRSSFTAMADEVQMAPALVLGRLDALLGRISQEAPALAAELAAEWPSEVYSRILKVISDQMRRVA